LLDAPREARQARRVVLSHKLLHLSLAGEWSMKEKARQMREVKEVELKKKRKRQVQKLSAEK